MCLGAVYNNSQVCAQSIAMLEQYCLAQALKRPFFHVQVVGYTHLVMTEEELYLSLRKRYSARVCF